MSPDFSFAWYVATRVDALRPMLTILSLHLSHVQLVSTLSRRVCGVATRRGYATIKSEIRANGVGFITLDRPKALNALCDELIGELNDACAKFDADESVGAIVVTGSQRAFAAGADISEMATMQFPEVYVKNMFEAWTGMGRVVKPTIAAVNGFALGGGCELAMMCDVIIAGDGAKFGQPEITLGTIPGCGGTQRLVRAVGKSKAMEMCLTGVMIDAEEALDCGLVARVYPANDLEAEAEKMAAKMASFSKPAAAMTKEAINAAFEVSLAEGVRWERRLFHSTFATKDQKAGMAAFLAKEKATWSDE